MTAMRVEELTSEDGVRTTMRNVERSMRRFSRNEAQDIVQEAMARAVHSGVGCDAEPWIRTVARRIAVDKSRRAKEIASGGAAEMDVLTLSNASTPEEVIVSNEGMGLVGKAMQSMPSRYRDALLAYAEDQQADSVARRLGISAAATWTLLSRARSRLRQELDRVGYAFGSVLVPLHRWAAEASTATAAVCVAVGTTVGAAHAVAAAPAAPAKRVVSVASVPSSAAPRTPKAATNAAGLKLPVAVKAPVAVNAPKLPAQVTTSTAKMCRPVTEAAPATKPVVEQTRSLLQPLTSKLPQPVSKTTGCVVG